MGIIRSAGLCLAAIALTVLALPAMAQAAKPGAEAFGNLPEISQPKLSPDGKYFAVIQMRKNRATTLIYQTNAPAGAVPVEIPTGDLITYGIDWASNDRLIIVLKNNYRIKDANKEGHVEAFYRSIAIGADGSNPVALLTNLSMKGMHLNTSTGGIIGRDPGDPNHVYIELYVEAPGSLGSQMLLDLIKVDINTGDGEIVGEGEHGYDIGTVDWIMGEHAAVVARLDAAGNPLQNLLSIKRNGKFVNSGKFDWTGFKGLTIYGIAPDGSGLIVLREDEHEFDMLEKIDFATAAITPFFAVPNHDVSYAMIDRDTGRAIGAVYGDDTVHTQYFDAKLQAIQTGLEQSFPGRSVAMVSHSRDYASVIVEVSAPRLPPVYYFVNRATHLAYEIGKSYPLLQEADLGEVKAYPYKARDGLDIHAYLTLPPGKVAKNLPTVIMPHGGPNVSGDGMWFDWWAQFLANRGYAVLQPNFRGSAGYGKTFFHAGMRQWGLAMQDDLTDGVKKLIADGIADPRRVCIVGASYGGYAALAGATFTPELYRCAFAWAPVTDLPLLLFTDNPHSPPGTKTTSILTEQIGNGIEDHDRLVATSPALHAEKVKCPVLIMHGERDTTVEIDQSEHEVRALQKAGKTVEYIRIGGNEDHHLNFPETRIRMLTEMERFLKANIGD